jgi:O-antigen/teichoic acid export membrane protein
MSIKRQTLWSMAPLLVVTVLNLISVPLFYRYLGAEMYALWFYVLSLSGAFGFADLGLGVAVGRYVGVELGRGDLDAARSYWGTGNALAIPLLAIMSFLFGSVGVIFGPRWFNVTPAQVPILQWSFVGAGIGAFFAFYGQFWNILAQVNLDFKFVGILRVALAVAQIGGSLFLAWSTRNASLLVAWGSFLNVIQLVALIFHARARYEFGVHWKLARRSRARAMAAYTAKTFLTLLINSVLAGLDRLALGRLAPPSDFAHYTVCSNVGIRVSNLSVAIMGPIFGQSTRAVGAGGNRTGAIYEESFNLVFGWLVLLSVWLIVWKNLVLHLWLGHTLATATVPLLPPLIVAYCLTSLSNVSGAQLGPLDRVGTGLVIHIFAGAMVAICVYFGWLWAGIVGVAYGFLVSRFVLVFQDLFVIRLVGAKGWLDVWRWLHVVVQVAIGFSFWAVARTVALPLVAQAFLALVHGFGVALWLIRKDLAVLSAARRDRART